MKRSYGVGNLMTISVWVSLRNVSFVFKVFLLRNGQNLYFRISGLHFFNFCSLFGDLMFTLFMNSYTWNHIHESAITKFFAIQTLCLSGCVARIADFGSSEPGTKPGERSVSLQYAIQLILFGLFVLSLVPFEDRSRVLLIWSLTLYHCATEARRFLAKKIVLLHLTLFWGGGYHNPVLS